MFYACKDNIYISFCKYFRYKKTHICYYLTFRNKICRLFYIYFHYIYLIIYNCFVVLFLHGLPCWCVFPAGVGVFPAGGSIHSAGVSSLLMLVSSLLVVVFIRLVCLPCWCRCHRGHIRSRTPKQGTHEAPQCGGGLASESKFHGENHKHECSNYQLFRL